MHCGRVYTHIYTHTYTDTHTHTQTQTYIHIQADTYIDRWVHPRRLLDRQTEVVGGRRGEDTLTQLSFPVHSIPEVHPNQIVIPHHLDRGNVLHITTTLSIPHQFSSTGAFFHSVNIHFGDNKPIHCILPFFHWTTY